MEGRLAALALVLSFLGVAASIKHQYCTQKYCTGECKSKKCLQTCPVPGCIMNYNCAGFCKLLCNYGECPEITCVSNSKNGVCSAYCYHGNCKMKASAGLNSTLYCAGGCDMECSNYDSKCKAYCPRGNCNFKCKAKVCQFFCIGPGCHAVAGIGTKEFKIHLASNATITCANGSKCGEAGCDASSNCVSYVKDPLHEISTPTKPPITFNGTSVPYSKPTTPFNVFPTQTSMSNNPSHKTVPKQKPVGAAETVYASILLIAVSGICIAISH